MRSLLYQDADVKDTVAYKIAVQAVPELADKELLPIYMPMTHDAKELEENHEKGAKALEACLDQGKNVVFLTLGDPCVYSTFSYLQHRVEADWIHTELVSGITFFLCCRCRRTFLFLNGTNSFISYRLYIVLTTISVNPEITFL